MITQGETNNNATQRNLDEFWFFPEENNILTNTISLVQYIDVKIALGDTITHELIHLFNLQLEKLNLIQLEVYLSPEEIEHLEDSIEDVKYNIKGVKNM